MLQWIAILAAVIGTLPVFAQGPPCPPARSAISISSGWFEAQPGVAYRLRNFRATLLPKSQRSPQCFARITVVSNGEIFVGSESITRLFAQKLQQSGSKIRDLRVEHTPEGGILHGTITKLIPLHFTIAGPVTTNGSEIRLTAKTIKADGIPIKELLKLAGAELNSIVNMNGMNGIEVGDDYLAFTPERVANLRGHIASVTPSSQGLTLRYGGTAPKKRTPEAR